VTSSICSRTCGDCSGTHAVGESVERRRRPRDLALGIGALLSFNAGSDSCLRPNIFDLLDKLTSKFGSPPAASARCVRRVVLDRVERAQGTSSSVGRIRDLERARALRRPPRGDRGFWGSLIWKEGPLRGGT